MSSLNIIYGLTDPRTDEIRYVGQSSQGLRRTTRHRAARNTVRERHTHKAKWINNMLKDGVCYEAVILQSVPSAEDLDEAERGWIKYLRSMGGRLTNVTDGGGGTRGHTGFWTGKHLTPETKAKLSAAHLGRKHTVEACLKISRSGGGRPVIDSNGNVYPTVAEASRQTGFPAPNISRVLKGRARGCGNGRGRRSGGVQFRYLTGTESATKEVGN